MKGLSRTSEWSPNPCCRTFKVKLLARRAGPFDRAHGSEHAEELPGKAYHFILCPFLPAGRQGPRGARSVQIAKEDEIMPKMTGAEYVARALKGYGVTHIFFVPTVLSRSLAVMDLEGTGISRIITHGEKAAVYMADGFARASGRPGITMAQMVGGLNLAAGLRDPYLAGSPVIAFTGGYDSLLRYRHDYQEAEDFDAFKVVTKFNAYVDDVRRFPDLIRQAFRSATTGTPGPVHLRFRGKLGQIDEETADLEVLTEEQFGHYPPFRPEPEMEHVTKAARLLGAAKKPIIVAGGGVRISGAKAELVELAERLQIPVATSLSGKEIIPGNHPLSVGVVGSYSRRSANQMVCEADLVFFAGTRAGGMTTHTWRVPKIGTPAIQLDINAEELGRNYPLQASIHGDAKASLRRLIDAVDRFYRFFAKGLGGAMPESGE